MSTTRRLTALLDKVSGWFDSPRLFWWPFGVFLFAAIWMVLSGAYSMAYDEYYHYGIIELYLHKWSPFFTQQPPSADAFGAVTRDPSYLYHYGASFPLRVFAHFVHTFTAQIIFLRLLDVVFFAIGLLVFRAVLRRAGMGLRASNLALGFFMLLPVTPFVAAQINYDDPLFLCTAVSMWLAVIVFKSIREQRKIPSIPLLWLITVAMLASLVKYAYLPILAALFVYFVVALGRTFGWRFLRWWNAFKSGFAGAKRWHVVLAVLFVLVGIGLFTERYGVNIVRYKTPAPECNQVLNLRQCQAYEPFARNYTYHQGDYDLPAKDVLLYPFSNWLGGMVRSVLFVVGNKQSGYQAGEPLLLAYVAGYAVLVGGLILVLVSARWLWLRSRSNQLFIVVGATYTAILFIQNFTDFMHTHVPVAIQGRYLTPILPLFLVLVVQAAGRFLHFIHPRAAIVSIVLLSLLLLEGGSLIPFLVRQQDSWLWDAPIVRHINHATHDVVTPLMLK